MIFVIVPAEIRTGTIPLLGTKMSRRIDLIYKRIETHGMAGLAPSEKWYFALYWLYLEVDNGGFHQFLGNDAGQFAQAALEGFSAIGAARTADIVRRVIAIFPGARVPLDVDERRHVLLGLPEQVQWTVLGDLTNEFYATPDDVSALLEAYAAKNASEFPTFGSAS
jgi:hypothetical protein